MDVVEDFLQRSIGERKPVLAMVWLHTVHGPHIAMPDSYALYAEGDRAACNTTLFGYGGEQVHQCDDCPSIDDCDYKGSITQMDLQIGRLRSMLQSHGVANNTLLWFSSDNGPAKRQVSTQGLRQCKGSLFEGGVREPGLLEWPAMFRRNVRSDAVVGTWDILPTVLDLLSLPMHPPPPTADWPIDGVSLVPLLKQLVAGTAQSWTRPTPAFWASSSQVSMLDWPWKILLNPAAGQCTMAPPYDDIEGDAGPFLFNLMDDPSESHDLSRAEPAQLARMSAAVDAKVRSVLHSQQAESKCAVSNPRPQWPPNGPSPPPPPPPSPSPSPPPGAGFTLGLGGLCAAAASSGSHAPVQLGACSSGGARWVADEQGWVQSADEELGGMKSDSRSGVPDPCAAGDDVLVATASHKDHFVLERTDAVAATALLSHASCSGMCAGVAHAVAAGAPLVLVNCSTAQRFAVG